jgi:CRISPR-associated exonuclease Cas4
VASGEGSKSNRGKHSHPIISAEKGRRFKCEPALTTGVHAFSDLARAAYCPRQHYYAARDGDGEPPPEVRARRDLAFRYPELRGASDAELATEPIERPPPAYRAALDGLAARDDWDELVAPSRREVLLAGRECRGVAYKILAGDPPTPTFVSPGTPPERGVWRPQRVRAVAMAKALAWERGREIPAALVEYPAHGVVRRVRLTARNKAAYRETVRVLREMDGPPPRVDDEAKCTACDYREECGVRTRSLKSLLGL